MTGRGERRELDLTEFLGEFRLEAGEKLDILAGQLLRLERDATNPLPIREMFLAAHTIKGGAAMLRLTDIEALAHGVEDLLSTFRNQVRTLDGPAADLLFLSIDGLRALVEASSADAFGAELDPRVVAFAAELRANATGVPHKPVPPRAIARALLVDGSPTVRELHRMLLEDAGYESEACGNGDVALSRAMEQPFDLIVSGLQNQGLSGFELTVALRADAAYRDVPVILTSADTDPGLIRRAVESGAHALVRKGGLAEVLRKTATERAA